jgi:glycine cleavage system transcriptional repressor
MHIAVSAVGVDRPGIVAAVSRVLVDHGGNVEDSRMALLGGHFAMMLIVAVPDGTDAASVEVALSAATGGMDLVVSARPVAETAHGHAGGEAFVLTVYGADRPGIVADVTGALASVGANITDLATHVAEGNVYIMVIEVALPPGADAAAVERAVRGAAGGVDISFGPLEAETL